MSCLMTPLEMWSLYEMPRQFPEHPFSVARNFYYVCCECPGFAGVQEGRHNRAFLSLQMVFFFASAAIVCAIINNTSALEP